MARDSMGLAVATRGSAGGLSDSVRRKQVCLTSTQGHFRGSCVLGRQAFGDPVRSGTFTAEVGGPGCTPGKETQLGPQAGDRLGAALQHASRVSVGCEGDLTSGWTVASLPPSHECARSKVTPGGMCVASPLVPSGHRTLCLVSAAPEQGRWVRLSE